MGSNPTYRYRLKHKGDEMKTSEFLSHARERLNKGWCQNLAEDTKGNVCAWGALWDVGNVLAYQVQGVLKISATALGELNHFAHEQGFLSIVKMNDHPETTKLDMLNAFDKVIIGLEEKGL